MYFRVHIQVVSVSVLSTLHIDYIFEHTNNKSQTENLY